VPAQAHPHATAPSPEDVERIAAIESPVLRNLEITQCYSRLAAALAATAGGRGANWCTYATWASRQAGRTIRGEDALAGLQRRLGARGWWLHPARTLWRRLLRRGLLEHGTRLGRLTAALHTPLDAVGRASDAVARGNLKVFAEIGLAFARYAEPGRSFDRFVSGLAPGDPPDGQDLLRSAFARYERQRRETDPQAHAELGLLANLEIGLHEQTRLQEQIEEALDAPVATQEELAVRALVAVFPGAPGWWAIVRRPAAAAFGLVARALQRSAERVARELITESFMVLALPGRVLALGTHLDAEPPELLRAARDPDLAAFLARYEPAPPADDDCGARDWARIDERMHYISHLFRAFHFDDALTAAPFTPAQVAAFERGVVPDGEL
jgi:hypothetical protein